MAIKANIISVRDGYTHLENILMIRIKSRTYNLLIMDDYVPLIGEIDGNVDFQGKDGVHHEYNNVHGYYRHCKNEFSFMMEV